MGLMGACGGDPPSNGGAATVAARRGIHLDAPRELATRDGAYRVTWFPVGGEVPVDEHFEVDVTITTNADEPRPVTGAEVSLSCFMPDHGHGMLREPRSEELGAGRYRVKGMLLHMGGFWTVSVNLVVDGVASTADDELNL